MTNTELSSRPWDVSEVVARGGIHVIDAIAVAPGAVRLTVLPRTERGALINLIRAGYDATVSGPQTVLAVLPEPTD